MEHGNWPIIIIIKVIEVCLLQSSIVLSAMSARSLGSVVEVVVMQGWLAGLEAVPDTEHSAGEKGHPLPH